MSWRTNRFTVWLRDVGRWVGANRILARLILGNEYEQRYDEGLRAFIKEGVCIWDVGANVGHYSMQFAKLVGESGKIYAFEPSPVNYSKLESRCSELENVDCFQLGLGSSNCEAVIQQGEDDLGATSRVLAVGNGQGATIQIRTGLTLRDEMHLRLPTILKIDVEGLEHEVLKGFGKMLGEPSLKAVGVEVHFKLMADRGEPDGPSSIEKLLEFYGFKVNWMDPSHILAKR